MLIFELLEILHNTYGECKGKNMDFFEAFLTFFSAGKRKIDAHLEQEQWARREYEAELEKRWLDILYKSRDK